MNRLEGAEAALPKGRPELPKDFVCLEQLTPEVVEKLESRHSLWTGKIEAMEDNPFKPTFVEELEFEAHIIKDRQVPEDFVLLSWQEKPLKGLQSNGPEHLFLIHNSLIQDQEIEPWVFPQAVGAVAGSTKAQERLVILDISDRFDLPSLHFAIFASREAYSSILPTMSKPPFSKRDWWITSGPIITANETLLIKTQKPNLILNIWQHEIGDHNLFYLLKEAKGRDLLSLPSWQIEGLTLNSLRLTPSESRIHWLKGMEDMTSALIGKHPSLLTPEDPRLTSDNLLSGKWQLDLYLYYQLAFHAFISHVGGSSCFEQEVIDQFYQDLVRTPKSIGEFLEEKGINNFPQVWDNPEFRTCFLLSFYAVGVPYERLFEFCGISLEEVDKVREGLKTFALSEAAVFNKIKSWLGEVNQFFKQNELDYLDLFNKAYRGWTSPLTLNGIADLILDDFRIPLREPAYSPLETAESLKCLL